MSTARGKQYSEIQALTGTVSRDYFGNEKKVYILEYKDCSAEDYTTIETQYNAYLTSNSVVAFVCTDTNNTISADVHVDLKPQKYRQGGESYPSDFELILKEA